MSEYINYNYQPEDDLMDDGHSLILAQTKNHITRVVAAIRVNRAAME